jgi:hypothetical protein
MFSGMENLNVHPIAAPDQLPLHEMEKNYQWIH